eukprot:gnl/Dysnectes_brevis/2566_a3091_1036.p1 GENE.gnl/Dysnectes_brevis/2566_a3091_1036~~gnl/Dysnectes_brevis/2566_a3091_1036.p1  ORF type:complete len:785 (+),score=165.98 gnl/Dysnectes_brevis/2566_a3091_1036:102-2357(+)
MQPHVDSFHPQCDHCHNHYASGDEQHIPYQCPVEGCERALPPCSMKEHVRMMHVDDLLEQTKHLREKAQRVTAELDASAARVVSLEKQRSEEMLEHEETIRQMDKLSRDLVAREKLVKEHESAHRASKSRCDQYQRENVDLFEQNAQICGVLDVVGGVLLPACAEPQVEGRELDLPAVRTAATNVEDRLCQLRSELETTTGRNQAQAAQIHDQEAQIRDQANQITEYEARVESLTTQVTELEGTNQDQTEQIMRQNDLILANSAENESLSVQIRDQEVRIRNQEARCDSRDADLDRREASLAEDKAKLDSIRDHQAATRKQMSQHGKLLMEREKAVKAAENTIAARREAAVSLDEREETLSKVEARNEKLRTEYQQLSSDHRKVSSEHEKLQSDHQLLSSEHQRVQTELEQLRSGLEHPVQPIGGAGDSISGQGIPNISIAPPQTSELVRAQLGAVQVDRSRLLELEEQNKALQSQVDHLRAELYKHQSRTPIERHKRDDVPLDGPTESSLQLEGQIQELLKDKQQLKRLLSRSEDAYRRCNEELSQTKMSFATLRDKIKLRDSTYCHVKSTPLLKLLRDLQAVIKMEGAKGSAPGSATLQYLSAAPAHKPSFDELINTLCHQMPILHDMSSMHSLCLGAWSSLAPALGLFPTDHFTVLVKKLQIRDGMELMTSRLRHSLTYGLTKTPSHGRSQASTPTTPSQYSPTKPTSVARKTKVRPTSRAQGHSYIQRTGSSQTKQVKPLWNGSVRK